MRAGHAAHVFNSRFSSLRKRQSVPSAMIFCGVRPDHAGLLKPQRVKPDRVFRIVVTPLVVRHVGHRLQGIVIVGRESVIDDLSCDALRLRDTKVCRLENGAQDALGR